MAEQEHVALEEFWMQDITHSLDVGLVVLDLDFKIVHWNHFMENHHGASPEAALGREIFELFDDLPSEWFKQKVRGVHQFKGRAFTTWEQRPYLFRMNHYRPFTSAAEFMYQNITLIPLTDLKGHISHVGIIVYDVTDVAMQKIRLQEAKEEFRVLAKTDDLTGLYNRGYWDHRLKQEFDRYSRTRQTPTLIMLDIDHFKKVNDTYGHDAGDEVIRMLANLLVTHLRATDVIGRLGGEEFGVILIDTGAGPAEMLANRLRKAIEDTTTRIGGHDIKITSSFGVTELDGEFEDDKHWFKTVDLALYDSKAANRNTVTVRQATSKITDPLAEDTPQS